MISFVLQLLCACSLLLCVAGDASYVLYLPTQNAAVKQSCAPSPDNSPTLVYTGDGPLCNYERDCEWSVVQFDISDLPDFVRATITQLALQLTVSQADAQTNNLFTFNVKLDKSYNNVWQYTAASAQYLTSIGLDPASTTNTETVASFSFPVGLLGLQVVLLNTSMFDFVNFPVFNLLLSQTSSSGLPSTATAVTNYEGCFYSLLSAPSNHEVPKLRVTYDYSVGAGISFRKFVNNIETSFSNAQLQSDIFFLNITTRYQHTPLETFRFTRLFVSNITLTTHLAVAQSSPLFVEGNPSLLMKIDPEHLANLTLGIEADLATWVFSTDAFSTAEYTLNISP